MNEKLFEIVHEIIQKYGEGILADSPRFNSVFGDLVKSDHKQDARALRLSIQAGAYQELKRATDEADRQRRKTVLAHHVHFQSGTDETGASDDSKRLDVDRCLAVLDLLELVVCGGVGDRKSCPNDSYAMSTITMQVQPDAMMHAQAAYGVAPAFPSAATPMGAMPTSPMTPLVSMVPMNVQPPACASLTKSSASGLKLVVIGVVGLAVLGVIVGLLYGVSGSSNDVPEQDRLNLGLPIATGAETTIAPESEPTDTATQKPTATAVNMPTAATTTYYTPPAARPATTSTGRRIPKK